MSAWPGKYVIGLTGNIATGKSVVRKMLEHLGAYGIDADALAHRVIAQGAPGYQPVVETFGTWILDEDGQINRGRLGRIVFSDPQALARLEGIIHPFVGQAVDILIRRSKHAVIVLEAIKLIESGLRDKCDSLWVTCAPPNIQLARLVQRRGLTPAAARQRMAAQPPQEAKVSAADVVIRNAKSFEDTWRQVSAAWEAHVPRTAQAVPEAAPTVKGELSVQRAGPRQAAEIAELINHLSAGEKKLTRKDIMQAFGEKAFLLLKHNEKPAGLVGWKVENLIARTDDVYLDSSLPFGPALQLLMEEVEKASKELQCEISLLFLPADKVRQEDSLKLLGYEVRSVKSLGVSAWQEAAVESMPAGSVMLFKQLRQDRVLRPV